MYNLYHKELVSLTYKEHLKIEGRRPRHLKVGKTGEQSPHKKKYKCPHMYKGMLSLIHNLKN